MSTTLNPNCSQCDTPRGADDLRCSYCGAPFVAAPLIEGGEQLAARRPVVVPTEVAESGAESDGRAARPVSTAPATTPDGPVASAGTVRPWPRFWARIIDFYVFGAVITALIDYSNTGLLGSPTAQKLGSILALAVWMLIEARLLQGLGTTPGKLLMNVRVRRRDGRPASSHDALLRSLRLWWRGLGMGLPVVSLVTAAYAYRQLQARGETSWDRDGGWVVEHGAVGLLRILATIAVVLAAFAMSVVVRIGA
jgi:uncharacterized RDD family membrane protein YckC